jgi:hypothetical protein
MEPESSLPRLQEPAPLVPILSQISPVHVPYPTSWRFILILSSHLRQGLPSGLFPSGFRTKILYAPLLSPIRATYRANLILLNSVTRIIYVPLGTEIHKKIQWLAIGQTGWTAERDGTGTTSGREEHLS